MFRFPVTNSPRFFLRRRRSLRDVRTPGGQGTTWKKMPGNDPTVACSSARFSSLSLPCTLFPLSYPYTTLLSSSSLPSTYSPSGSSSFCSTSSWGSRRTFTTTVPVLSSSSPSSTLPIYRTPYDTYSFAAQIIATVTGKETNESLSSSVPSSSVTIMNYFANDEAKAIQYAHKLLTDLCQQQYLPALNRLGRWSLFGIYGEPRNIRTGLHRLYTVAVHDPIMVHGMNASKDTNNDENELMKNAIKESCYWYAHAWTKMTDMAAEENILLQNTQQFHTSTPVSTTAVSSSPSPSSSPSSSSESNGGGGCQGNGSCGGTGQCATKEKNDSSRDTANGGGCGNQSLGLESSAEEAAAKEKQRTEAAKNVMKEIRSFRKRAIANKVRRTQGLPPLEENSSLSSLFTNPNDRTNASNEDPRTLPLKTNENRAEKYFLKAALLDHEDSQVALGNLCMRVSTETNPRIYEAIGWYELAAKVAPSLTYAQSTLPNTPRPNASTTVQLQSKPIYNFAETTSVSSSSSNTVLTSSNPSLNDFLSHDSLPHPDAVYNLGMIYWEGIENYVQPDPSKALSFFETGATLQDISSLYFLGVLYMNGNSKLKILPNTRRGLRLIELAAAQGHHQAALFLAQFWRTGKPKQSIEPDMQRSVYFLELAGNTYEDTDALAELGDAYYHGNNGFTKDLYKAFMYYEKAAKQGHMHAAVCTGSMYFHGMGIPQNYSTAAYFYKLAGERGSPEGWRNLASLHAMGQGVVKDLETAKGLIALANKLEAELNQYQQQLQSMEEGGGGNNSSSTCGTTGEVVPDQGCGKTGGCGCKSN